MLFRGVICCSIGLYAVQEGYMDAQEDLIMFRGVICCSGGYMDSNTNTVVALAQAGN